MIDPIKGFWRRWWIWKTGIDPINGSDANIGDAEYAWRTEKHMDLAR